MQTRRWMMRVALVAHSVVLCGAYPSYIQCDLTVKAGKSTTGEAMMTTTTAIMGQVPMDSATVATESVSTFTAGSEVTLSFSSDFVRGVVKASEGSLQGTNFVDKGCGGSGMMVSKSTSGAPGSLVWTAPSDVSSLSTITISVAGATGYAKVHRRTITLTKATPTPAPTPAPAGSDNQAPTNAPDANASETTTSQASTTASSTSSSSAGVISSSACFVGSRQAYRGALLFAVLIALGMLVVD
eukprot:TRINITY_DN125043_c0_g1_i2.p1 TRINITY_DN125043_c0_g1~~TRINITY_DN125043_c0_g1_i2.p1  ORF type:complete len:242 (-),score=45.64 TRINITY_DN125043_c0_g1_i2:128-853(-)